jgi:hypothetical protein
VELEAEVANQKTNNNKSITRLATQSLNQDVPFVKKVGGIVFFVEVVTFSVKKVGGIVHLDTFWAIYTQYNSIFHFHCLK